MIALNALKTVQYNAVAKTLDLKRQHSFLDVGCATGRQYICLAKNTSRAVGIDVNDEAILATKKLIEKKRLGNIEAQVVDGESIPFADHAYDRVLCADVVSIATHPVGLIQESLRVLKNDGALVICNGTGYKTIRDFYQSTSFFKKCLRSVLLKITALPKTLLQFYRSRIARNIQFSDQELMQRYEDVEIHLERVIKESGGVVCKKRHSFCGPNEWLMAWIHLITCALKLPVSTVKFISLGFLPLFLLLEFLFSKRQGLSVIYLVKKNSSYE